MGGVKRKNGLNEQIAEKSFLVEWSTQLSNQIVQDFKAIAELTYLIPMMEGDIGFDETRYKEQ